MVINPIVGSYIPIIRIHIKGGMSLSPISRLLTMAHIHSANLGDLKLKLPTLTTSIVVFLVGDFYQPSCLTVPFLPSWKLEMDPSSSNFLSLRVIFHFHDYGKKTKPTTLFITPFSQTKIPCLWNPQIHVPNLMSWTCRTRMHLFDQSLCTSRWTIMCNYDIDMFASDYKASSSISCLNNIHLDIYIYIIIYIYIHDDTTTQRTKNILQQIELQARSLWAQYSPWRKFRLSH